ncbi:MAG TPA: hypothetical protein VI796_03905, partial [Candidatus Thermoplasmatota archaeon]|nr:hypothetical protein [Candidatus Thermoplasmatota archaeon]
EALEAFLKARHADREELRRVKEAKRKRRGGFERGFVVESTLPGSPSAAPAADTPPATPTAEPERAEPLLRDV